MKNRMTCLTLFFLAVMGTMYIAVAGEINKKTSDLIITINGFENSEGIAKLALINSEKNYNEDKPFQGYDLKIVDKKVVTTISELAYGEYAVKIYHDENSNNKLDTKIFGIPTERYGFSNDARGTAGPPDYKEAAFKLDSPEKEITINIK